MYQSSSMSSKSSHVELRRTLHVFWSLVLLPRGFCLPFLSAQSPLLPGLCGAHSQCLSWLTYYFPRITFLDSHPQTNFSPVTFQPLILLYFFKNLVPKIVAPDYYVSCPTWYVGMESVLLTAVFQACSGSQHSEGGHKHD